MPDTDSFSCWDKEKKKSLWTCIRSSMLRTREAFSSSGVFKRKRVWERERSRQGGGRVRQWVLFRSHFISHCVVRLSHCSGSAMPTARRKASLWEPSIGCHSDEIWGDMKWNFLNYAKLSKLLRYWNQILKTITFCLWTWMWLRTSDWTQVKRTLSHLPLDFSSNMEQNNGIVVCPLQVISHCVLNE